MSGSDSEFWQYFSRRVFQNAFVVSWGTSGKNIFFWNKNKNMSQFLHYEQKSLSASKFYSFRTLGEKIPVFVKKFCWFVRADFHPIKVLLWGEQYFSSSENFLKDYVHPADSSTGLLKLHSTCPIKLFGNFFCKKIKISVIMCGFWRKTSAHGRKKLAASSKLNSPCPGYFMRSFFIKWHDLDLLSLLAEDLRHGFQMWFVRVLGNVLRRNIVFEGITFVISVWIVSVNSGVLL